MNEEYKRVSTSSEVWIAIRTQHPEMCVFGSYSAPDGDQFGDHSKGVMFTSYGFKQGDFPVIEARTTWDIDRENPSCRKNEHHEYWLCLPNKETESIPETPVFSSSNWRRFFFEGNMFFDFIEDMDGWKRLKNAYPDMNDNQLLEAREATYGGHRSKEERERLPNYGFRLEHDGEKTLRDFFSENGMVIKA